MICQQVVYILEFAFKYFFSSYITLCIDWWYHSLCLVMSFSHFSFVLLIVLFCIRLQLGFISHPYSLCSFRPLIVNSCTTDDAGIWTHANSMSILSIHLHTSVSFWLDSHVTELQVKSLKALQFIRPEMHSSVSTLALCGGSLSDTLMASLHTYSGITDLVLSGTGLFYVFECCFIFAH